MRATQITRHMARDVRMPLLSTVCVYTTLTLVLVTVSLCGEQARAINIRESAATQLIVAAGEPPEAASDTSPTDAASANVAHVDSISTESAPANTAPADAAPADAVPADAVPADAAPADAAPADSAPADAAPADAAPADTAAAPNTDASSTDSVEDTLPVEDEVAEDPHNAEKGGAEDAAREKEAERAADAASDKAGIIAAEGITKETAASSCSPDKVSADSMRLCKASADVLAGESAYRAAMQTMEGARDMRSEGETEKVLQNVLSQIEESLTTLASTEGATPGNVEGEDQVVAEHEVEMESKVAEAVKQALSLLDSAFPMLVRVKQSRGVWRGTVSAAADARKEYEATIDKLASVKAEARTAKKIELASVLNETRAVHARLMDQLEAAKNMSISARDAMVLDSTKPGAIDAMMQFSRQATTAATATKKYHDKLEHLSAQLRKELALMEERDGVKSSALAPAPSDGSAEMKQKEPVFDDLELMALKTKSEHAMEELAQLMGNRASPSPTRETKAASPAVDMD